MLYGIVRHGQLRAVFPIDPDEQRCGVRHFGDRLANSVQLQVHCPGFGAVQNQGDEGRVLGGTGQRRYGPTCSMYF